MTENEGKNEGATGNMIDFQPIRGGTEDLLNRTEALPMEVGRLKGTMSA
jgi:hypothetical protein